MPLYISEYSRIGQDGRSPLANAPEEPVLADQVRSVSGTSAQSAAFNAETNFVELHASEILSVAFGTNPTATTSNMRMAAGDRVLRAVPKGKSYKVAAIANT